MKKFNETYVIGIDHGYGNMKTYQNVLNQALLYLGIPHLAFEKGERMIEDEARANTAPTNVMLLDCLQARREFAEKANRKFGLDNHVYFNEDLESYNINYTNNIDQMAQDKVILSSDSTFMLPAQEGVSEVDKGCLCILSEL